MKKTLKLPLLSLLVFSFFLLSFAPAQASTLFFDEFNGNGELHSYNSSYEQVTEDPNDGTMGVFTDHVETTGFDPAYVYTGIPGDNKCASIDFNWTNSTNGGWADILIDSTSTSINTRFRVTSVGDQGAHEWLYITDHNNPSTLQTGPVSLVQTQTHTLKACVTDSTVTGYVDDMLLFTGPAVIFGTGYLGFQVQHPTTYLDNFRIEDVPAVVPTNKDQCKKNGWKNFPHLGFKNQGDCVSYVNHH
jgi:hypothetical protein